MTWAEDDAEWSLIDGLASAPIGTATSLYSLCHRCQYAEVLASSPAKKLFLSFAKALLSGNHQSNRGIKWTHFETTQDAIDIKECLIIAIAALQAFVQLNWTGPDLPKDTTDFVTYLRRHIPDALPARALADFSDSSANDDDQLSTQLQKVCLDQLTEAGEPAYHLCKIPHLLLLSLRILQRLPRDDVSSIWWSLRAASIHSRILDTPVLPNSSLLEASQKIQSFLIHRVEKASNTKEKSRWCSLLARLYIDRGLLQQRCGNERAANELFMEAAAASGMRYKVTGALGKKTKFQREDKTILVLLAESSLAEEEKGEKDDSLVNPSPNSDYAKEETDGLSALKSSNSGWTSTPANYQKQGMPSEMSLNDETLLEQTRFTSTKSSETLNGVDAANPQPLHPLDSSILLALCLNISNASPENGLTSSEMSAFVSRVLAHARNWSVHTLALLLRSRLEANRTKTAQRSVLQMQALLDQMPTSDSTVEERLRYFHELELPSTWEMQAELARRYAALGVIQSALEIFERIEMWEEAVQCWGALGRQDRGIEVVKDLLEGRKVEVSQAIQDRKRNKSNDLKRQSVNKAREAKLWCLLGDLEVGKSREHYLRAWQISLHRSARAARSLGGAAFATDNLHDAVLWLRRALKINPLYTRSWFMLGCAYMKLDSAIGFSEAARCFRRCTALDDEDGESWNNLASCYLRLSQQGQVALQEAQMAQLNGTQRDAEEVLDGVLDVDEETESVHSLDSGVAINESSDAIGEDTETRESNAGSSTAFDIKLLAHRALTKSLRLSHDDWRVWNNYTIVSVDCGLMGEAIRGLTRVIQLRSAKGSYSSHKADNEESLVDIAVLNRLVDAVIRAPSKESDATTGSELTQGQVNHSPHEGHGLYPSLITLFTQVILPIDSSSAAIHRAYARLLLWRGLYRSALESHLTAWRVSLGSESNIRVTTEKSVFVEAIEELKELCEILENYAERLIQIDENGQECEGNRVAEEVAMSNWRFRGRSLIRSFIGRTKDSFDGEPEWESLIELRDSFGK